MTVSLLDGVCSRWTISAGIPGAVSRGRLRGGPRLPGGWRRVMAVLMGLLVAGDALRWSQGSAGRVRQVATSIRVSGRVQHVAYSGVRHEELGSTSSAGIPCWGPLPDVGVPQTDSAPSSGIGGVLRPTHACVVDWGVGRGGSPSADAPTPLGPVLDTGTQRPVEWGSIRADPCAGRVTEVLSGLHGGPLRTWGPGRGTTLPDPVCAAPCEHGEREGARRVLTQIPLLGQEGPHHVDWVAVLSRR